MEKKLNLNHRDKEYLKMAMLKHEETFKQQVYELHRLYRIQKALMKDAAKNARACSRAEARLCMEDDDESNLELTLGPRSYYQKKIKAAEPDFGSDSGPSFSTSCGPEMPVSNTASQDRLNSPPWLFRALSLNVT